MSKQDLIDALSLAQRVADSHDKTIADLEARYGNGVRPGWVSADISIAEYRRDQQLSDIALIKEQLEIQYANS